MRVLGSKAVSFLWRSSWSGVWGTITYHAVPDHATFRSHIDHILGHYVPVDGDRVEAAMRRGIRLPRRAVWITFDDGDPSVVDVAQPVLDESGITATMFVCPAVIGTETPYWWQMIHQAIDEGIGVELGRRRWTDYRVVTALKRIDDAQRRRVVARAEAELQEQRGCPYRLSQLSLEQLRRWVSAGHHVGNHTWDHPCLDRCSMEEQQRQIAQAHDWLAGEVPKPRLHFAYPNGNWSLEAEQFLRRIGYSLGLLFNHRLSVVGDNPLRLNRLAIDADAELSVLRARLSGGFSALLKMRRSVMRKHRLTCSG